MAGGPITSSAVLLDHALGLNAFFYVRTTSDRSLQLAQFGVTDTDFAAYTATVNKTAPFHLDPDSAAHHLFGSLNSICADMHDNLGIVSVTHGHGLLDTTPGAINVKANAAVSRMTVHDAIGWLCAIWPDADVTPPEQVRLVALDYYDIPNGWVYYAAGLTPHEARDAPSDQAQIMAGLRGRHLPPIT